MNSNTTNSLIRCAILLCSTTIPCEEKLDSYTVNYLQSKGYTVKSEQVTNIVDKYSTGAKLYGNYRDTITRIQNIGWIQENYRLLWLYSIVAQSYEDLTPATLLSLVNNKYEEERVFNENLDRNKYICFKVIDREFVSNELLKTSGKVLSDFASDFEPALERLFKTFEELSELSYMCELYNGVTFHTAKANEVKRQESLNEPKPTEIKKSESSSTSTDVQESIKSKGDNQPSKIELQLRDEIRLLKNDKHDLEVKLSYAKKDAIREIITSLTAYGWNCPLSELYRLLKEEDTPEKIRGIINNLFMALDGENIKVCRDKVGDIIELTEKNQKSYDPYKNEELYIGEKAEIYYPGYRYDHEIMVRPIVRRIKEKESE